MIPDSNAIETRAATSLPNACEATSTTSAPFAFATCARASAAAATPCFAISSDSTIAMEVIGPCVRVAAIAAPFPEGANTTAQTEPIRAPTVASSAVVFVATSPWKSARIITVLISTSSLLGMLRARFRHRHYR